MTEALRLGLSSWIIQDGNYGEFDVGQKEAFAVEFSPHEPMQAGGDGSCAMRWVEGSTYDVLAEVCFVTDRWWALDIGPIKVFCDVGSVDRQIAVGDRLAGLVYLGVDPFSYRDGLYRDAGAPSLIYDWRIDAIERDDTPWVEVGPRTMDRDRTRQKWTAVSLTDAWGDDSGNGAYVLTCARLSDRPRATR